MEDMRNISGPDDVDGSYMNSYIVTPFSVNMEQSFKDFSNHVNQCNLDFKENIIKQVQTIKLKDTSELNIRVEEIKSQEARELASLNKNYMELDLRCKKLDRKNDRYEEVIHCWIEQWRQKRQKKIMVRFLRTWAAQKAKEKRQIGYCDEFYDAGCKRRGMKAFKLFA